MRLKKVKMPTFSVENMDREINLWEFAQLRLEISQGKKPAGLIVTNTLNNKSTMIQRDGRMKQAIYEDHCVKCLVDMLETASRSM